MPRDPLLWHFHDARSGTLSHLIACAITRRAALIDPVLGYEPGPARTDTIAAERIASLIQTERLALDWVLETHVHADHLSSAQFFKQRFGAKVAIGARVRQVQRLYTPLFAPTRDFSVALSAFDRLWHDDERFHIGELEVQVLSTPGHTLDGVTYLVGRHAFVGDTVFRADFGTARTDLVGGNAHALFQSISRLYSLPPETMLHFCHDYPHGGTSPTEHMSVERVRQDNVHVKESTTLEEFVALRQARDSTLPVPDLLIPAVQVNVAAGRLPPMDANGIAYLKVPLNVIGRLGTQD